QNLDRRELRTLTYALDYSERNLTSIFSNANELSFVLELLNEDWRDSFLNGLVDCLLKKWESPYLASLSQLANFIYSKVRNSTSNRLVVKFIQKNIKYFDLKNGASVLGAELALKDIPLTEATKFLSVPETWFSYPYFSKVIVAYYEQKQANLLAFIAELKQALLQHNYNVTSKRVISKLILQATNPRYINLQEPVKHLAFHLIGDPEIPSYWAEFENATPTEKEDLRNARKILNEWIVRQFIDIFFKVCINDTRRKHFWLRYAKQVVAFKVYGSEETRYKLESFEQIKDYLPSRYVTVESQREVSAFILYIGNYMLIEFSDLNYAFYAYRVGSPLCPELKTRLKDVDKLRNSSLPRLLYRTGTYINSVNSEGRLSHNDGELSWEQAFEFWLNRVAGIYVNV
ncbi:MAG: EH signature domain-containing protein, partial [Bacteroidia bacterium]|nr:EH signature domain-containing protein [Bacteroidia bacterium]